MIKMKMNAWIATDEDTLTIFGNLSKTAYIIGFAINFFLYTMSGRVFRDQLRAMLCRYSPGHHRHQPTSEYMTAVDGGTPGCRGTLETTINNTRALGEITAAV